MGMLRHLFVLGRDITVPPEGLAVTLDRHMARGEQIEIIRDRRKPPSDTPSPQALAGRERRRASPLAEQLRVHGFAIFSRQEDATRRTVPRPMTLPAPAMAPPPPPPMSEFGSRSEDALIERDARRTSPFEQPRMDYRPFARPSLSEEDELEEFDDRRELPYAEDWRRDTRPAPRRGRLVALVLVLLVAAGAFFFYLGQHVELTRLTERLATLETRAAATAPSAAPAPAPEPATPAPPAPASPASAPPAPASPAPAQSAPTPSAPAPSAAAPVAPTPAAESPRAASSASGEVVRESAPREVPRASLPPRRSVEQAEPAPVSTRTRSLPTFPGLPRVEVSRAAGAEGTTFTVRLTDPAGRPLSDAYVSLRQTLGDGRVRETPLEPTSPPGSYRGSVPGTVRRGDPLALRMDLGNRRVEMPVTD
jgi:hypothetical protein